MALPDYFAKSLRSLQALMADQDATAIETRLSSTRISLAIDGSAIESDEGRALVTLVSDLLARLYPAIDVIALDARGVDGAELANAVLRTVNPLVEVGDRFDARSCCTVVVGMTKVDRPEPAIYAGSDGWYAIVDAVNPVGSGKSNIPFGAGAAACIAAANVFRVVFASELGNPGLDRLVRLDMRDYSLGSSDAQLPERLTCDLCDCFLIGLGAIGHGAGWVLSQFSGLRGRLHLVDPEDYDATNPQRYVATPERPVGKKVDAVKEMLATKHPDLEIHVHPKSWDQYLAERGDWNLPSVAVAVDSAEDRQLIQASLPESILNAWTHRDHVGISRHDFLASACLCCLYIPDTEVPDEDDVVSEQLCFPSEALMTVRKLLDTNAPLDAEIASQIESQVGVPAGTFSEFCGRPLRDLYQRGVCGGVILQLGGHVSRGIVATEVPLAFQSAMAGIMLAAELVCSAAKLRSNPLPVRSQINLLRPIVGTLNSPEAKHSSGRCICQDADYIASYRFKYARD